jgi:hypothetical protein
MALLSSMLVMIGGWRSVGNREQIQNSAEAVGYLQLLVREVLLA